MLSIKLSRREPLALREPVITASRAADTQRPVRESALFDTMAPIYSLAAALLAASSAVLAVPTPSSLPQRDAEANGGVSQLSDSQITAFKPYTHFASTAYCLPLTVVNWSCGHNCQANPNFKPLASGGDGIFVQFCESSSESVARVPPSHRSL